MDSSTSMRNNMYQYLLALQANCINTMPTQPQLAICHPVEKPGKSVDQSEHAIYKCDYKTKASNHVALRLAMAL